MISPFAVVSLSLGRTVVPSAWRSSNATVSLDGNAPRSLFSFSSAAGEGAEKGSGEQPEAGDGNRERWQGPFS